MMDFTKKLLSMTTMLMVGGMLFAQTPFWTEDFDGALPADWKAIKIAGNNTPSSNWIWTTTGPAGSFSIGPIVSTTASNGWMIFDSDLNCSGNQNVWLQSPKLDLSDKDAVVLQFQTHYRRFNDKTWVEVSTDSTNWTAIEIFEGLTNNMYANGSTNSPENPFLVTVNLTPYVANQSTVWFAFHFLADPTTVLAGSDIGCAYSWQIDDVALFDYDPTPATNLKIYDWFYAPSSFAQPESQIKTDTMAFFAYVSNIGSKAVPNIVLKADVRNSSGNVLFVDSVLINSLDVGVTDSVLEIPSLFIPDQLTVGDYSINYSLYSLDSLDADLSDNGVTIPFSVTDNLFAKENGVNGYRGGLGYDFYVGAVYNTSNNLVDKYKATKATFAAAKNTADGPLINQTVKIVLLEVKEDVLGAGWGNFNTNQDYLTNTGLTIRSINDHVFTTDDTEAIESEDLYDFDTDEFGVELKPGNRYILLAHYEGDNTNIFHGYNTDLSQIYFPSSIVYTSDDNTWYLGGWAGRPAIYMRMEISLFTTTDERALPDNALTFYPNPVSDKLNVQLSLENPALANVTLADLNGRVILIDEIQNAQNDTREYNVSNLPSGTYLIRVATKEGTKTKKFVVQR